MYSCNCWKVSMMKLWSLVSVLALAAAVTACEKSSPTAPTIANSAAIGPDSVLDSRSGVTMVRPRLISPAANERIGFGNQPITLVIANGASTGKGTPTYTFEVASDEAFNNKVYSKGDVPQGGNGQTSLAIDKLHGNAVYFWRVQISIGGTAGPYSLVRGMSIGPEVVLQAPVPVSPGPNGTTSQTPSFTVNNVGRSGPVTTIVYKFDVATDSGFTHIVASATAGEGGGGHTSGGVSVTLTPGTYFWRAQATDTGTGVTSPYSAGIPFVAQAFDVHQASFLDSPNMATYAETAKITSIAITPNAFEVDFNKRLGAGHWPDVGFGPKGALEYTLGMCAKISNHWYCAAVVQFWYGRDLAASTPPSLVGRNWFYDARWGALIHHQPADGESIGLYACAGNCRDKPDGSGSSVHERTNIQFIPWTNHGSAFYSY